jgi:glycosyltransferase involved in cell wall biosynthesis
MSDRRLSIVVAAPPMKIGGTEQHLLHVLPGLAKRGIDITVVLLESGGALEPALRSGVYNVITPSFNLPRPLRTMQQAFAIWRAARRVKADVIHAFLSEPCIAAAGARFFMGKHGPALVHGRRSLAFYSRKHRFGQRAEIASHALASALVGNSKAVADELTVEAGGAEKVCLIPNGIPLGEMIAPRARAMARARFGIPPDALVLTQVANLHIYKGHADLLNAVAAIRDKLPDPWRLLLPGRDGGEQEALVAQTSRLGLIGHVIFPGEWPGSLEPYAASDIGILASHTEGFSNSLIEGMAAGLPMIATRVGGNLDALDDGENGFLVERGSLDELANAILALAEMPDLRQRMGLAGREKVLQRFSLESCIGRYERLWRSLAEGAAGQPSDWVH